MRVRLESIGCRLNISEIESMARVLATSGHRVVGAGESADLCIVNSCAVTGTAARKSRHILRQIRRSCPNAKLVATGCFAELAPEETLGLGADLLVGNQDKDRLPTLLHRAGYLDDDPRDQSGDQPPPALFAAGDRTRAFIKIQDGCDHRCTFCVVTIARGPGRSRASDDVVDEVRRLHRIGFKEIVLSGVHLGSYGEDRDESRGLENLVRLILTETDVPRVRLSSLEPWDLDERFFELLDDPRVLPHLHLPLQSGCGATLRRMARRIDPAAFSRLLEAARNVKPDLSISTDIMVGFPGENEDEFSESISFVEQQRFSRLHVFRFSPRDGTRAATMPNQVPGSIARERSRRMHLLGSRLERDFNRAFINTSQTVLWETSEEFGVGCRWNGLTDHYIRVVTETGPEVDLANEVMDTEIVATVPGGVLGAVEGVTVPHMVEPSSGRELPIVG
jgi:threonylcarbamoyladenosine tRNA methylthiotransferase MtaB